MGAYLRSVDEIRAHPPTRPPIPLGTTSSTRLDTLGSAEGTSLYSPHRCISVLLRFIGSRISAVARDKTISTIDGRT